VNRLEPAQPGATEVVGAGSTRLGDPEVAGAESTQLGAPEVIGVEPSLPGAPLAAASGAPVRAPEAAVD
jgi:hypothetical protein